MKLLNLMNTILCVFAELILVITRYRVSRQARPVDGSVKHRYMSYEKKKKKLLRWSLFETFSLLDLTLNLKRPTIFAFCVSSAAKVPTLTVAIIEPRNVCLLNRFCFIPFPMKNDFLREIDHVLFERSGSSTLLM